MVALIGPPSRIPCLFEVIIPFYSIPAGLNLPKVQAKYFKLHFTNVCGTYTCGVVFFQTEPSKSDLFQDFQKSPSHNPRCGGKGRGVWVIFIVPLGPPIVHIRVFPGILKGTKNQLIRCSKNRPPMCQKRS